jgi:hypothetical protein
MNQQVFEYWKQEVMDVINVSQHFNNLQHYSDWPLMKSNWKVTKHL